MKKILKIIFMLVIATSWMLFIFKLSSMSSKNSNGKSTNIISMFIEDTLDITNDYGITNSHPSDEKLEHASELINAPMRKVIHASVYFVLAFFSMTLWNIIFDHKHYIATLIVSFSICVCFAISDEFHQTFIAGRTGRPLDVLIDSAGAIVGLLFYSTYYIVYKSGYKRALQENEDYEVNK